MPVSWTASLPFTNSQVCCRCPIGAEPLCSESDARMDGLLERQVSLSAADVGEFDRDTDRACGGENLPIPDDNLSM
jgi:hypothetical protein